MEAAAGPVTNSSSRGLAPPAHVRGPVTFAWPSQCVETSTQGSLQCSEAPPTFVGLLRGPDAALAGGLRPVLTVPVSSELCFLVSADARV